MSLTLTRRHNVDRFGYLIPTRYGNLPMVGAVATYRPGEGRFGGAVAVEEGTTNLLANPSFETSASDVYASGTATFSRTQEWAQHGNWAIRIEGTSASSADYVSLEGLVREEQYSYTASSYIYNPNSVDIAVRYGVAGNYGEVTVIKPSQVKRLTYTTNVGLGGSTQMRWREMSGLPFCVDACQWEAKPFATSFVNGTRAAGRLSYPKSLIAGLNALTVAAWTPGPPYWVSAYKYLVAAQTTGTAPHGDVFALYRSGANNGITLWARNDANSSASDVTYNNVWDGNWHLIVGVINKSPQPGRKPIELYVDGQLVASSSNANAVPDLSNIDEARGVQVGNWRGSMQWNGLIDELLILPYAASEEEIASWYEAQGPLPPHPQASLQWDRQAVRPAQMVKL